MPAVSRKEVLFTEGCLLVMAAIWGVNFVVLKFGTRYVDPFVFTAMRMALGVTAMLAIIATRRNQWPSWRDRVILMALGVLGHGIYQAFFVQGVIRTRAGTASLIVAASPAVIAIVGRLLGVETPTRRAVAGIVLSLAGVACVILGSAHAPEARAGVVGDLLVLAAVGCWAFYTIGLRSYTLRVDGMQIAFWTLVGGILPMFLLAIPGWAHFDWQTMTLPVWGALAYTGLLAMVLAYLFWYRGIRVIGPTRAAMFTNLQPVFALGVAWPLLGERPTTWQGIGAMAVLGGILLTRQPSGAEPARCE